MIDPKILKVGDVYRDRSGTTVWVEQVHDRNILIRGAGGRGYVQRFEYQEYWDACTPLSPKPEKPVQNPSPYRFDLLPADAMLKIAELMTTGDAEHGRDNWKKVMSSEHEGRSIGHMYESMSAKPEVRKREDHYTHAALRAIFALQMAIEEGKV